MLNWVGLHRAEATLDVQYYIWQYDITGTILLDALYRAAERGVHVRLLPEEMPVDSERLFVGLFNFDPRVDPDDERAI